MEIINYVQEASFKRDYKLPTFFQKKERNKKSSVLVSDKFFTESINENMPKSASFIAKEVKTKISVRSILKSIGRSVTDFQKYVAKNIKKIVISTSVLVIVSAGCYCTYIVLNHKINHTGPLAFETENTIDIENLNKLMAAFALEGTVEYDDSGALLDTADFIPQVFTQPVSYKNYTVKSGDTISGITKKFGLRNLSTLISINDIGNVRQLAAGQKLKIPSIDGVIYTVKSGDTLDNIISKNNISLEAMLDVNDLSSKELQVGQQLFLPGVALDSMTLRNAMGDLFKMPIAAPFRWTSMYGPRIDPIAGHESFHTGVDMACPTGTPILASMSGRVTKTGVTRVYGNYVIIDHGNGYQTLYAHMSKIIAKEGQWVNQGTRIGLVGSTGYSTGPHLHFTVYKNGQLIDPMSVLK